MCASACPGLSWRSDCWSGLGGAASSSACSLLQYTLCELLPDLRQATSVMLVTKYAFISLTVQRLISCGELLFLHCDILS